MVNEVSIQNISKVIEQTVDGVKKTAASSAVNPVSDKVSLSQQGIDFQNMASSDVPMVAQERIDQLKEAIATNTYTIDYGQLAQVLIKQNLISE